LSEVLQHNKNARPIFVERHGINNNKGMEWVRHAAADDGWVLISRGAPAAASSSARALPAVAPPGELPTGLTFTTARSSPSSSIIDIWKALKDGHKPGSDPNECKGGRFTIEACLCEWVSDMPAETRHGLLRVAVSAEPPNLTGLAAVLQLASDQRWDVNAYMPSSRGLFSLAAFAITNNPNSGQDVGPVLRILNEHGADLRLPAKLSHDGEPAETLVHLAVLYNLDVLHVLRECGAAMDTRGKGAGAVGGSTPLWDACSFGQLHHVQYLHEECSAGLCTTADCDGQVSQEQLLNRTVPSGSCH
jgi:hypothetical protein